MTRVTKAGWGRPHGITSRSYSPGNREPYDWRGHREEPQVSRARTPGPEALFMLPYAIPMAIFQFWVACLPIGTRR